MELFIGLIIVLAIVNISFAFFSCNEDLHQTNFGNNRHETNDNDYPKQSSKYPYQINFQDKTYYVSKKRLDLIQKAAQGDEESQYELIIEYYESSFSRSKEFIPELCFFYTEKFSEKDLGVLAELGDLYFYGVGTKRDKEKAISIYKRALEIFDNPPPDFWTPGKDDIAFRQQLLNTLKKYEKAR